MTQASPILTPNNTLTLANTTPPAGVQAPPNRFILFGSQWLTLQNYITQALQLPINIGDWNEKYGDFADKQQVDNTLAAMTSVHNLASQFGNPTELKQKIANDPNYLSTDKAPTEIYSHIVWLANQIENTSSTFTNTFSFLQSILSPTAGTPQQRADNLKAVLAGPGGLQSSADTMQKKTADLISKLASFDRDFSAANSTIQEYAGGSSKILADANQLIGQLTNDIQETQDAADEAYKKWRDYTIAAVTSSVGLMILTCGLAFPIALGLGIGLGVAAAKERAIYNKLTDKVRELQVDKQKKTRLVTDLTGLNGAISNVAPAMTQFRTSLETIEGVWVNVSANLSYIVNNYGVDQLSDLTWVMQTLKILDAQKKWQNIADTTQQFAQHSLVSYDFNTSYGQQIAS